MSPVIPLPEPLPSLVHALERTRDRIHPGLYLDKFVPSWNPEANRSKPSEGVQKPAILRIVELSRDEIPGLDFSGLLRRWEEMLAAKQGRILDGTLQAPLTLHLARASALENAGICLHPVYGFVYLPGTGLKGLAHAYACEEWMKPGDEEAWIAICRVFGWAQSPWLSNLAERLRVRPPAGEAAGSVVFHDAWPCAWPKLQADIVNNHHRSYYEHGTPPGDWESPIPVYFLSVPAGTKFRFPVSRRRSDTPERDVDLAATWLAGGLQRLGAGAKTASGYGNVAIRNPLPEQHSQSRPSWKGEIELVSPGFLAGPRQDLSDCDLRAATLRGALRWWWRTLHAGYLPPQLLHALEAAIWGDTRRGSAVRILLGKGVFGKPHVFNFRRDRNRPEEWFIREFGLEAPPQDRRTGWGLYYLSYGMDKPPERCFLPAGSSWKLEIQAGPARFFRDREDAQKGGAEAIIEPSDVLEQATAALSLLCRFGGVGSKSRKGFGSLAVRSGPDLDWNSCLRAAANLRKKLGLPLEFQETLADSCAFGDGKRVLRAEVPVRSCKDWQILNRIGLEVQAFAKKYAHDPRKAALGLPRKIHGPRQTPLPHQDPRNHRPPQWLGSTRDRRNPPTRWASPVWIHLARNPSRTAFEVRILAFPSRITEARTDLTLLKEFVETLRTRLQGWVPPPTGGAGTPPAGGGARPSPGSPPGRSRSRPGAAPSGPTKRAAGTPVRVVLLQKREKGGFVVQEVGKTATGTLTLGVPPTPIPELGSEVQVYIQDDDPRHPQYRWDPIGKGN